MHHLSSSMEALFKKASILQDDMQHPSNVLSDTRISMGFAKGYDEPVFMVAGDRLIPFMYSYCEQKDHGLDMEVMFVLMDVNGDGQVDTMMLRENIDDLVDMLRDHSSKIASGICEANEKAVLLVDVTQLAWSCILVKKNATSTVPLGMIVSDDDGHTVYCNIRGWFLPTDPRDIFFTVMSRGVQEFSIRKMGKNKIKKEIKKLNLNFKNTAPYLWLGQQIPSPPSYVKGSSVFARYDYYIAMCIEAAHERNEHSKLHRTCVEQRDMQSQVEEAEREKERRAQIVQARQQRLESEHVKVAVREAELAARHKPSTRKEAQRSDLSRKTPTAKETSVKQISIEQARQHEADLKEREERRIADIVKQMQSVQIGRAIQQGW